MIALIEQNLVEKRKHNFVNRIDIAFDNFRLQAIVSWSSWSRGIYKFKKCINNFVSKNSKILKALLKTSIINRSSSTLIDIVQEYCSDTKINKLNNHKQTT